MWTSYLFRAYDARMQPEECFDRPGIWEVMSMLEDDKGQLWLGTGAGVYRFDAGRFNNFTRGTGELKGQQDGVLK